MGCLKHPILNLYFSNHHLLTPSFCRTTVIKNKLLDIESLYTKVKSEEDHYRFDKEELIYKPLYATMDLTELINKFTYYISEEKEGKDILLNKEYFESYLKNEMIKNGFMMTIVEFDIMNTQMTDMRVMSLELMEIIEREIERQ